MIHSVTVKAHDLPAHEGSVENLNPCRVSQSFSREWWKTWFRFSGIAVRCLLVVVNGLSTQVINKPSALNVKRCALDLASLLHQVAVRGAQRRQNVVVVVVGAWL